MARKFEDIMASLPPERQQAINKGIERLISEEMTLQELRKAREYSQKMMGDVLEVNQAAEKSRPTLATAQPFHRVQTEKESGSGTS
jgi:TRAP-type C4-dicarboxylate transport system substrate-binding protein